MKTKIKALSIIITAIMLFTNITCFASAYQAPDVYDLGNGATMTVEYGPHLNSPAARSSSLRFNVNVPVKPDMAELVNSFSMDGKTKLVIEFDSTHAASNQIYLAVFDVTTNQYVFKDNNQPAGNVFLKPASGNASSITLSSMDPSHNYNIYIAAGSAAYSVSGRVYSK